MIRTDVKFVNWLEIARTLGTLVSKALLVKLSLGIKEYFAIALPKERNVQYQSHIKTIRIWWSLPWLFSQKVWAFVSDYIIDVVTALFRDTMPFQHCKLVVLDIYWSKHRSTASDIYQLKR